MIAKDAEAHKGQQIIVYGYVTQFDAATGSNTFRANVDGVDHPGKSGCVDFDTNTVLNGDADGLRQIVEGDLFRANVTVSGEISYETQIGGKTTVPSVTVDSIQVTGSTTR